ncbi:adenylate/guanylate cyclase domain-containing protein (plasmid) [Rhizobium beringeri]|uniref:NUDIX domain-containing protein n=1 Tax=Rhizobium beringeri TaxID=3019934 RepID=UPI002E0FE893|nr:adenylate/guanylate cyclase domain-containing protein [Rhizobium beringeri]
MKWNTANILFADVKGYSGLTDDQMRTFTTKVLKDVGTQLEHLDITDKNTWGDGIVIIAERIADVCEAALKLRDVFRNTNWSRLGLPRLDIRISVHHGEYLAGKDSFTKRPTFCGRTIVTAARIEPVTPPGRIWITQQAALLLTSHIDAEKASKRPDFFAIDEIGKVSLAKKYGSIEIACLRRFDEPALSQQELKDIQDSSRLREAEGGVEEILMKEVALANNIGSFYIVIGVTTHKGKVLLVKRKDNSEGLTWMFPSGKKWPTADAQVTIEKEVLEETGVSARVVKTIAEIDKHPTTGFRCAYFALEPSGSLEVTNGDPLENSEVEWVLISEACERLGASINPTVAKYLTAMNKPVQ